VERHAPDSRLVDPLVAWRLRIAARSPSLPQMAKTLVTRIGSTELSLVQEDITRFPADAIVNAANRALRGGGGVDGAIHAAAGPELMEELRARYPAGCPTGSAVITDAGRLPARHVIHAVGPAWGGGTTGEPALLASAYRTSLDLAAQAGALSVAFPAISCGIYGYPLDRAAAIAIGAVRAWLTVHPDSGIQRITFVLRGDDTVRAFAGALQDLDSVAGRDSEPVKEARLG